MPRLNIHFFIYGYTNSHPTISTCRVFFKLVLSDLQMLRPKSTIYEA